MPEQTLDSVIRKAFGELIGDVHVSLPGKIETFDATLRTATVKPMVSRRYRGVAQAAELPVIQNVPVVEPRTTLGAFIVPLSPGDPVLLVFGDRAIENWLGSSGVAPSEPLDVRKHDLTDAFAIPGGWPNLQPGLALQTGVLGVQAAPGTPIYIGNGADEFLDIVTQFMDIFTRITTGLMASYSLHFHGNAGADPPSDALAWDALTGFAAELSELKLKMQVLQGL